MKWVQFSDVHLDASLRESKLALPEEKRQQRQREIRLIVADACTLARERASDLILIPGDLFDDESASFDTIHFLIETFKSVAPLPIFITPGNHDPYLPQSPYSSEFLAGRGMPSWPNNVRIFPAGVFVTVRLPGREDVSVTGIGNIGRGMDRERILGRRVGDVSVGLDSAGRSGQKWRPGHVSGEATGQVSPQPGAMFNLLLFHGSREPFPPGKEATMPFNDAELLSQGFDYAAVGHYHSYIEIKDREGQIRGAYSGTPAFQKLNEAGEKFVLVGEISENKEVRLERVRMDRRTLHVVEVNCSGLTHSEAVMRKIREEARKASQTKEDVVFVRLTGRFPRGVVPELSPGFLADEYFHVAVDRSELKPDYDLEKYLGEPELMRSVEGEFVKTLRNMMAEARDEKQKRLIEAALYYGLDALTEERLCGRYEA